MYNFKDTADFKHGVADSEDCDNAVSVVTLTCFHLVT